MNYYQYHIGDFNNATRHLSLVERAIYRDLLDMYYDTEQAIDASSIDRLARRLQCVTEEHRTALSYVLDEFFKLIDGQYINSRCEREIAEYHGKRKQASEAGKASAKKRAEKKQQPQHENPTGVENPLNENLTDVQPTINHKPLTNNQEPFNSSSVGLAQNLPPVGWTQYQPHDHKRYDLIELSQVYETRFDFYEQAKLRHPELQQKHLESLFDSFGRWFIDPIRFENKNTAHTWLIKWSTWVENNKSNVIKSLKAASVQTKEVEQSKQQGYFMQMFSKPTSSIVDVLPEIGGTGNA